MTATKTTTKTDLTPEHKAALAEGREQGRIVRNYLDALESNKPKRGRPRSEEIVQRRLDSVNAELESETLPPVTRLQYLQVRINLTAELERLQARRRRPRPRGPHEGLRPSRQGVQRPQGAHQGGVALGRGTGQRAQAGGHLVTTGR